MKAFLFTQYGSPDLLDLVETENPVPSGNQLLIKIKAASVNAADWHIIRGVPFVVKMMTGLSKPKYKIPGADFSGIVEAAGSGVKKFKPGDEVFGDLSGGMFGAFAEYVCADEKHLCHKPANISFEEAAAVPLASVTALQGLRKGGIKPGIKVLINGASGGVGTYAVQAAKAFGAEVTAVCSTGNVEIARSLGADFVIDYTMQDFSKSGKLYDLIFAANGNNTLSEYKSVLNSGGSFIACGGAGKQVFSTMLWGPFLSAGSKKFSMLMAKANSTDLNIIKGLIEEGKIKPVIDKYYDFDNTREAIKYVEEGHAKGKVVIRM